jgi:hypothetical protein
VVGSDGVAMGRTAYVTFKDPKALEIALLLSVCPLALIGLIYNKGDCLVIWACCGECSFCGMPLSVVQ